MPSVFDGATYRKRKPTNFQRASTGGANTSPNQVHTNEYEVPYFGVDADWARERKIVCSIS